MDTQQQQQPPPPYPPAREEGGFCPNRIYYIGTWPGPFPYICVYDITDRALQHHPAVIARNERLTHLQRSADPARSRSATPSRDSKAGPADAAGCRAGRTRFRIPLPPVTDPAWKRFDKCVRRIADATATPEQDAVGAGSVPAVSAPPAFRSAAVPPAVRQALQEGRGGYEGDPLGESSDDDAGGAAPAGALPGGHRLPTISSRPSTTTKQSGLPPPLYLIDCNRAWAEERQLLAIAGPAIRYPEGVAGAALAAWTFSASDRPLRTIFTFPPGSPQDRPSAGREVSMSSSGGSLCAQVGCRRPPAKRRIPLLSAVTGLLQDSSTAETYAHGAGLYQWARDRSGSDQFLSLYRHAPVGETDGGGCGGAEPEVVEPHLPAAAGGCCGGGCADECLERVAQYRYLKPPFWSSFSGRPSGGSLAMMMEGGEDGIDPLLTVLGCINMGCRVLRMDLQPIMDF